jgi:serine protease Do
MRRTHTRYALGILVLCLVLQGSAAGVDPGDPRVTPEVRVFREAHPAVVNISAKRIVRRRRGLFGNDPFDEIFPSPFTRRVPVQSLGSGVLIDPSGYIVTNAHVVRRASEVSVTLADDEERTIEARLISVDPDYDLAVLKIAPDAAGKNTTLPHLPLGRSDDLMVGEKVIAIGNPLGYANSLTSGHVSAVKRTLKFSGGVAYHDLIQIDAPINPGNSGGALLNIKGELIGINTAIRADAQNIGFAIPVGQLAQEMPRMLDFQRINRVSFGAKVRQDHDDRGCRLIVTEVEPDSPAHGKLVPGDQILAMRGQAFSQITDFACRMLEAVPGTPLTFLIQRGRDRREVTIVLKKLPKPDGRKLLAEKFGLNVRPITPQMSRRLRLSVARGLLVTEVAQGCAAQKVGIAARDVLFQVDRFYVEDFDDVATLLEDLEPGQKVRLGILRRNVAAWVTLPAAKAPEGEPSKLDKLDPEAGVSL